MLKIKKSHLLGLRKWDLKEQIRLFVSQGFDRVKFTRFESWEVTGQ